MEGLPQNPLIVITPEDIKKIRAQYDLNDVQRINESVSAVQEWAQKQEHLKGALKYIHQGVLERLLLFAKGSVEATKKKLEKLLTYRNMMPDLCSGRSIKEFEKFSEFGTFVPLPKMCPTDQSRIMVTQVFSADKLEDFNLLTYFRYCFLMGEIRLHYDYWNSERYIIDLSNMSFGLLSKLVNPAVIKKAEILCTEVYGTKIKGIHFVNAPSYVDKIVLVVKQGLKAKVATRIYVHNSYADLHKYIPKEILPEDFDGDGPSLIKLAEQWKEMIKSDESVKIFTNAEKWVSDESKRTSSTFNEEYLGMPGSFRKLDLD
ncbi:unnamed protein product [Leptidea sinapis]|uniref:CRAL-TRIO domain-containing protein n=1 Tax=Leptidea sinapis TaxID=189913 RepID=A0A5E4QFQ0_9NEOP|nr:unnamed protein product [Leptidea sinapis]